MRCAAGAGAWLTRVGPRRACRCLNAHGEWGNKGQGNGLTVLGGVRGIAALLTGVLENTFVDTVLRDALIRVVRIPVAGHRRRCDIAPL